MSIIKTLQTTIEDHYPSFGFEIALEWLCDTRFFKIISNGGKIYVWSIFL